MRADLIALLPELVLATLAMVVLLAGLASGKPRHGAPRRRGRALPSPPPG